MDVESLEKSGRRRGSCLDAFLVVSIIFLFVAVTAVAAGGVMVVMDLRSELKSKPPTIEFGASKLTGVAANPAYKMQNFAYLRAQTSELKNSTMNWAPVPYGAGRSVGSIFQFNEDQHSLKLEQEGTYFMYMELKLTCVFMCDAGLLTMQVGDQLTCEVPLQKVVDSTPVNRKCWTVSQMNKQELLTQMTVSKDGLENWRLELDASGFGMFRVD